MDQLVELKLNLFNNLIDLDQCLLIKECLFQLEKLVDLHLDLRFNDIRNDGLQQLGYGLSSLSNLKQLYLDLATNQFNEDGLSILLTSIKPLKLKDLNIILYSNSISNQSLVHITELLKSLDQLSHLNLDLRFS